MRWCAVPGWPVERMTVRMSADPVDAVVVGGGIGALATAFRLRERAPAARIVLVEAGQRLGGVLATTRTGDGLVAEHGPDSLVRSKPAAMRLVHDLGLDGEVVGTRPEARTALVARGRRLIPVPEGLYLLAPGRLLPFVRSPLLSWAGKARMALDLLIPPRRGGGDESLARFVRRRLGEEALVRLAQPLVAGITTGDPERLSMQATFPQFLEAEQAHGSLIRAMMRRADAAAASGPRYSLFASLRGGLASLVEALDARLAAVPRRLGTAAVAVAHSDAGWRVVLADGSVIAARSVVVAVPAWAAAPLLAGIDPALARLLAAVPYAGCATMTVVVPEAQVAPLPEAAGFVVPAAEGRSLLACTLVHRKYAGRTPAGMAHLRAFAGGALRGRDLELDDGALQARLLADLRDLVGLRGEPAHVELHRWPRSMCQPELGHLVRTAAIRAREAALPGLRLVGNGYEGVGIPDLCAQAEQAAAGLAATLVSGR